MKKLSIVLILLLLPLTVSGKQKYLYDVLKDAAEEGTYAREYTGEHHDSFTEEPSKKIYHWYAPSNSSGESLANDILDKNNVIFANQCWQMVRTTDTGGVKMIYNGEPENGKCLNTRGKHVGYSERTTQTMNTSYYYGTSYSFDKTNNVFSLAGDITTGTIQTGQYTCKSTSSTGTCTTLYLVDTLESGTTYIVIPLNNNSNYSVFGSLQFNKNSSSLADVGYMYNTRYSYYQKDMVSNEDTLEYFKINTTYWYADSITWGSPVASKYNLDNPYQISDTSDYQDLVGKYTFAKSSQDYTDREVYYIAAVSDSNIYVIELKAEFGSTHELNHYNPKYTYTTQ